MKFKNQVSVVSPVNGEHATNKEYVDSKQKTISWADYQALSDEEQKNGTLYNIPDMPTTEPSETLNLYSRLAQIGLSGGNTIQEVFNALPEASILEIGVSEYAEVIDVPAPNGILMIHKRTNGRFSIEFKRSKLNSVGVNEVHIGQLNGSDGSGIEWKRLIGTSVPDVVTTTKTATTCGVTVTIKYSVVNGVCHYEIRGTLPVNSTADSEDEVGNWLPNPTEDFIIPMRNYAGVETQVFTIYVSKDGEYQIDATLYGEPVNAIQQFYNKGSYPVAEE